MTAGRRWRPAALIVAAVVLLSGCVTIPGDGPVMPADKVQKTEARPRVGFRAAGPSPGAGPLDLVRGFLLAAADFGEDHATARKFLKAGSEPRLRWRPESPVVIYPRADDLTIAVGDGDPPPSGASTPSAVVTAAPASPGAPASSGAAATAPPSVGPSTGDTAQVTVTAPARAQIDRSGQYTMLTGAAVRRTFVLTYTTEGWRISSLSDGILLSESQFGSIYQSMPVYFADRQGAYLVPDLRWFPVNTATTPGAIVQTVLNGPATWLQPAVDNVVPRGTQPTVTGVKVLDEVAAVDLTRQARDADARQRRILKRELDETLTADQRVVQVSSVTVTVEQQVFEIQPSAPGSNDAPVSGGPIGLRRPTETVEPLVALDAKGAVIRVTGGEPQPVKGLGALTGPGNTFPATEPGGGAYAVLAAERSKLLYAVPDGAAKVMITGARNLTPPSFDPFGWVWSAQEQSDGWVFASNPAAGAPHVTAPWLTGVSVRSLRLSREGARAVLVVVPPGGPPQVVACAVIRDADNRPVALGQPLRLLADAQDVTSAAWSDPTHVVVLARRPGQSDPMPWIVELGGDAESTLPVTMVGAVAVAMNSAGELWVTAANGSVQRRSFSSWEAQPGVRYPAVPG